MSQTYLAAYALASLANPKPTAANIEAVLKAVGAAVDRNELGFVMESIDGRDVNTLVAEGAAKMASAAGASAAPAAAAAGGASAAPAAAAAAKEEKVEEEEADDDMGFGLFD